jgi:hypothetical protein
MISGLGADHKSSVARPKKTSWTRSSEAAKQQRNEVENALALLCVFAALLLCDMKVFPTDV